MLAASLTQRTATRTPRALARWTSNSAYPLPATADTSRPKASSSFVAHTHRNETRNKRHGRSSWKEIALSNAKNIIPSFRIMGILQQQQQQQSGLHESDEKIDKSKSRKTYQPNIASKFGTESDPRVSRDSARNPSDQAKKKILENMEKVSVRDHVDPKPVSKKTTVAQKFAIKKQKPKPNIPTSPWVLVTNIPLMSKLSDLIPSLSTILDFEIKKGIIDLDQLFNENGEFRDPEVYKRLKEMDAHRSLYSTRTIKPSDNIPLLQLPSINTNDTRSAHNLITEARHHLSYRARPTGWFLRLPSVSISHAIQSHIRQASTHEKLIREQFDHESKGVRQQRKDWTEGLWRRVYNDVVMEKFTRRNDEESLAKMGEDEVDGGSLDGELGNAANEKMMWGGDTTIHASDRNSRAGVDAFFDEYARSHPYPMHSTSMPSVESVFGYHHLKCGSTPLHIQEFSPTSFDETKQHSSSWEQKSFHLGNLLDLSDSVVRVETFALKTTLDDVKYLFRGYDLKSIWPENQEGKQTQLSSSCYADLAKSIGWNVKSADLPQLAVDLFLEGKSRAERNRQENDNRVDMPGHNMFLVRFASASDARMAVRDKQGTIFHERRLILSQFGSAELM